MTSATATAGRAWARFGFGVGVVASVAANVAHSYGPPPGATPDTWQPRAGAIVAAAFWPVGLVITIEIIQRVQWPTGWRWWLARWVGLTAVAGIAAVISYRHLSGLMTSYGEDGLSATIGPLAVDGLMVVSSVALLAISDNLRRHTTPRHVPVAPVAAPVACDTDGPEPMRHDTTPPTVAAPDTDGGGGTAPRQRPRPVVARRRGGRPSDDLTRQRGIRMAREGADAKTIAAALSVTVRTAQRYVAAAARSKAGDNEHDAEPSTNVADAAAVGQ